MKTFLALLSFGFALAVPGAVAAEAFGISLPATIDPAHTFIAFVVSLFALLAFGDYARRRPQVVYATAQRAAREAKATHPLAA